MTQKTYEYLEHAADIKFRAYGSNHEDAFTNAGYALTDILIDHTQVASAQTKQIEVQGHTYEQILYDFLEKLIILIDTEQFLLSKVESVMITRDHDVLTLKATVLGDTLTKNTTEESGQTEQNYQTHGDVKAITYHEMQITKDDEGLITIEAVVDV